MPNPTFRPGEGLTVTIPKDRERVRYVTVACSSCARPWLVMCGVDGEPPARAECDTCVGFRNPIAFSSDTTAEQFAVYGEMPKKAVVIEHRSCVSCGATYMLRSTEDGGALPHGDRCETCAHSVASR